MTDRTRMDVKIDAVGRSVHLTLQLPDGKREHLTACLTLSDARKVVEAIIDAIVQASGGKIH